jgi:hypothetical protein
VDGKPSPERRPTAERRQQAERTNRGGHDDERTEGYVAAIHCDAVTSWLTITTIDGAQHVTLHEKAQARCPSIVVGDYVQLEGVKETEQRFDAYTLTAERTAPVDSPSNASSRRAR